MNSLIPEISFGGFVLCFIAIVAAHIWERIHIAKRDDKWIDELRQQIKDDQQHQLETIFQVLAQRPVEASGAIKNLRDQAEGVQRKPPKRRPPLNLGPTAGPPPSMQRPPTTTE